MKVVSKPIEMVAWFGTDGKINPVRFRIKDDEEYQVIKINKVLKREVERLAGNLMEKFTCITVVNNTEKLIEIKYEVGSCRWILFKI